MDNIRFFLADDDSGLAAMFCEFFAGIVNERIERIGFATVALSGGRTPDRIFELLSADYGDKINWPKVLVFWADERCVPPEDAESNYGRAKKLLLDNVGLDPSNIFRVRGENNPESEAERYESVIESNLRILNGIPSFDLILLGVGEDGHTASIFPGNEDLFNTDRSVAVTAHPATGRRRITLTGSCINNAAFIAIAAAGISKREILGEIFSGRTKFPVSHISPSNGAVTWFLTNDCAPEESKNR